jgi:small-conductance mechanosensitive channel
LSIFGIELLGVNGETGGKLLLTIAYVTVIVLIRRGLRHTADLVLRRYPGDQREFWTRQVFNLTTALLVIVGLLSIWLDDPRRLSTAVGLVTAGLAFALQRVVTAVAGYFVILRGKAFHVGDRIVMGGVRGDVLGLGLFETTIMEMGQPPPVQGAEPAVWIRSRQYTGRIVTVSNGRIFDEPVYNYTREFSFIWEEMMIPISYSADRERAEQIMLDVARRHTAGLVGPAEDELGRLKRRYAVGSVSVEPKVYFAMTDNWLELTVRFVSEARGVREVKDSMSRDILSALDEAGIGLASATFDIVGLPTVRVEASPTNPAG